MQWKELLLTLMLLPLTCSPRMPCPAHPYVKFETTEGDIIVELDGRRAPVTVANFLGLVDHGYYDGLIFHRVIAGLHDPGRRLHARPEAKGTRGRHHPQ